MNLKVGIIGLPNAGKSTFFNALTGLAAEEADYPFSTLDANIGVVEVPDERLVKLQKLYNTKNKVATTIEFYDIAGLVPGASKGEGLGNQFLAKIRDVAALCHLVRCYDQDNIVHVQGNIDPLRDLEIVNLEMMLADIQTIESRLEKAERKAKANDTAAVNEVKLLKRIMEGLFNGQRVQDLSYSSSESEQVRLYNLLSDKPVIYIANISESDLMEGSKNNHYQRLQRWAKDSGSFCIAVCARIESDLQNFDERSRQEFRQELQIAESGLDLVVRTAYKLLGLATFFTSNETEVRAWAFPSGMKAPACGGLIHGDFERGFIRVEVYEFSDLMSCGSEKAVAAAGRMRIEGKDYLVSDGDVLFFRFNV